MDFADPRTHRHIHTTTRQATERVCHLGDPRPQVWRAAGRKPQGEPVDAPSGPGESHIGQGEKTGQIKTLSPEPVPMKNRWWLTVDVLMPTEHSFLE